MVSVFQKIAPVYDAMNTTLSLGLHHRWKRQMVREAVARSGTGAHFLDVGTGTGDLAIELGRQGALNTTAIDPCAEMLSIARTKAPNICWLHASSETLPLDDAAFNAILSSFAARNFESLSGSLVEWKRVLRPRGWGYILEMHPPKNLLFQFYWNTALPALGKAVRHTSAYDYLKTSVENFHSPNSLKMLLTEIGFTNVHSNSVFGYGMVSLTRFQKC